MKMLIKPNYREARYEEVEGFGPDLELRCGVAKRDCEGRNSCESANTSDGEVLDEILF